MLERTAAIKGMTMTTEIRQPGDRWSRGPVLYPNHYSWIVLASSLDILMTAIVLQLGGREVNPVAERVIALFGMHGVLVFKFALMGLVIFLCEVIGREQVAWGRRVASLAILVPAIGAMTGYTLIARVLGY